MILKVKAAWFDSVSVKKLLNTCLGLLSKNGLIKKKGKKKKRSMISEEEDEEEIA